jgi:hypothetical protein
MSRSKSPLPTQGNLPSLYLTRSGDLCVSCPVLDPVSAPDLGGWVRIGQVVGQHHLGCRSGRPISTPSSQRCRQLTHPGLEISGSRRLSPRCGCASRAANKTGIRGSQLENSKISGEGITVELT